MAEEEVSLPGGTKVKKEWLIAGGALGVGIVGYAWWKKRSGASSGPTVLTVDPNDAFGATDRVNVGSSDNGQNEGGSEVIDTDAEWTQAGVEYMVKNGWEPAVVQIALGRYLDGQKLSAGPPNQGDIVRAVRGAIGTPPSGDKPIQMELPGTPSGPGTPSTTLAKVANLRVTGTTKNSVSLAWDPVSGAESYYVGVDGITDVSWANYDSTTATSYTSTEREPGQTYTFTVQAQRGSENGPDATITGTTKKR